MDEHEEKYVPEYLYKREYGSSMNVYFCPHGLKLLKYKPRGEDMICIMTDIYTWDNFKITHFFKEDDIKKKGFVKKYSFILNDRPFFDKTWKEMINTIQEFTLDTPSKRNLLLRSLHQYITDPKQNIKELQVADVIGFVPPNDNLPKGGWQLPNEFYFVSGNDFRADIEENIRNLSNLRLPEGYNVKQAFKDMYKITTIDEKDYILAYGLVAPFLFSLRSACKLMPLLALGGPGGKGKTAIQEYMTVKWWGNLEEIIGSALMDTKPRIQGVFTGSTIPICIDDCEDLKEMVTGIMKRYTTTSERVKKLNPDQSKKMDCEYCSPAMMSFNALPLMFDDPQFRQRVLLLYIDDLKKESEGWLDLYRSIPDQVIGRYIINQTKDMTFEDLVILYKSMDTMNVKGNRQKAIVRLMQLGKHFAKEWFDLELDLSELPKKIKQTLMAGNEEIIDLINTQIVQSENFTIRDGTLNNAHRRSWVRFPVSEYTYKREKGYLYTADNAIDLAERLGKRKRDLSLKTLSLILETEWDTIKYGVFYDQESKSGTVRGIFIPLIEINGIRHTLEKAEEIENEINEALESNEPKPIMRKINIDLDQFDKKKINNDELNKLLDKLEKEDGDFNNDE